MALPTMAYWVSPSGEIHPIAGRHMDDVARNPEKYGFTGALDPQLMGDERLTGEEGENLRISMVKNGWVRIRKYLRAPWVIEVWNVDRSRRKIEDWAAEMIAKREISPEDPAIVVEVPRDRQVPTVIADLANGILSEAILKTLWVPLLREG